MSILVVTPAGDSPTAPGGAEVGPLGMPDGRADEAVGLPLGAPGEHPESANKPVAPTTAPHSRDR